MQPSPICKWIGCSRFSIGRWSSRVLCFVLLSCQGIQRSRPVRTIACYTKRDSPRTPLTRRALRYAFGQKGCLMEFTPSCSLAVSAAHLTCWPNTQARLCGSAGGHVLVPVGSCCAGWHATGWTARANGRATRVHGWANAHGRSLRVHGWADARTDGGSMRDVRAARTHGMSHGRSTRADGRAARAHARDAGAALHDVMPLFRCGALRKALLMCLVDIPLRSCD